MVGQRQEKLNGFSAATHQDWGGPVPKEYSGPWGRLYYKLGKKRIKARGWGLASLLDSLPLEKVK